MNSTDQYTLAPLAERTVAFTNAPRLAAHAALAETSGPLDRPPRAWFATARPNGRKARHNLWWRRIAVRSEPDLLIVVVLLIGWCLCMIGPFRAGRGGGKVAERIEHAFDRSIAAHDSISILPREVAAVSRNDTRPEMGDSRRPINPAAAPDAGPQPEQPSPLETLGRCELVVEFDSSISDDDARRLLATGETELAVLRIEENEVREAYLPGSDRGRAAAAGAASFDAFRRRHRSDRNLWLRLGTLDHAFGRPVRELMARRRLDPGAYATFLVAGDALSREIVEAVTAAAARRQTNLERVARSRVVLSHGDGAIVAAVAELLLSDMERPE